MKFLKKYKEAVFSAAFLVAAVLVQFEFTFSNHAYVYLPLYGLSYLAVGGPVWMKAFRSMRKGSIFTEFFLMGIATVGAFAIGEYVEGVAVMLFYTIGEYLQHGAVSRAKRSIKSLIDQQPDVAAVERGEETEQIHPSKVERGEVIQVKPGEKVPLDGELLTDRAAFNTAALTGESKPMTRESGEQVWAGSINQDTPVRIRVTSDYENTKLSSILKLVREASQRKAPTQRFMSRFAGIYTPIVVWGAVGLTFLPYFFADPYVFQDWFYRALIFLVVSCPCGLVISIPLGYFGGIGAASQNGILFKGSDFLDRLRNMKTLFMDKTGTLTEGTFEVQGVYSTDGYSEQQILEIAGALEQQSTHPIARAIMEKMNNRSLQAVSGQQEISGRGLKGLTDEGEVLVGNRELLEQQDVQVRQPADENGSTQVHVALAGEHIGTIRISDRIKEDSKNTVRQLRQMGVGRLVLLSGDNQEAAESVGRELGVDEAYGGLLPNDKYRQVESALNETHTVGFIGDGVNDAPVITLADVGIAMGGIGSDATIETADVVIQTDQPSKLPIAVNIAHFTHRVVWQNIGFALGVKGLIMALALVGSASMWAAIFADVGVALIAIANAMRIQRRNYAS